MQDQRPLNLGCHLLVYGEEIFFIMPWADQITSRVIGHHNHVCTLTKLGPSEGHGYFHQLTQHLVYLFRFAVAHVPEEILNTRHMIREGPWAHDLSNDGHLVAHMPAKR